MIPVENFEIWLYIVLKKISARFQLENWSVPARLDSARNLHSSSSLEPENFSSNPSLQTSLADFEENMGEGETAALSQNGNGSTSPTNNYRSILHYLVRFDEFLRNGYVIGFRFRFSRMHWLPIKAPDYFMIFFF